MVLLSIAEDIIEDIHVVSGVAVFMQMTMRVIIVVQLSVGNVAVVETVAA